MISAHHEIAYFIIYGVYLLRQHQSRQWKFQQKYLQNPGKVSKIAFKVMFCNKAFRRR